MYQALYRKWRPKTFDEVIGQEHITETLKTQVRSGHLSHAYIFIGTRGTGKTTCARILAKAVNCENPVDGNPCNQCRYCRGIDDGSILDVVELDAASNTGVDNVRDLREEAVFTPAVARKRVYIIDEVHMLSLAAFNALLKIIEEPPQHLMFILATTELQKVPATILSRCQRHSFRRIPTQRLADYLMHIAGTEDLKLEEEAAKQIARMADGGVRDALSILDQCSGKGVISTEAVFETMGLAGNRNLIQVLDQILQNDTTGALQLFQTIWLDGKEPASFLGEMSGLLRDVLIVKAAPAGAGELISGNFEREVLDRLAAGPCRAGTDPPGAKSPDGGRGLSGEPLRQAQCGKRLGAPRQAVPPGRVRPDRRRPSGRCGAGSGTPVRGGRCFTARKGSGRKPGDADPGGPDPGPCRGNGSAGTDAGGGAGTGIETGAGTGGDLRPACRAGERRGPGGADSGCGQGAAPAGAEVLRG